LWEGTGVFVRNEIITRLCRNWIRRSKFQIMLGGALIKLKYQRKKKKTGGDRGSPKRAAELSGFSRKKIGQVQVFAGRLRHWETKKMGQEKRLGKKCYRYERGKGQEVKTILRDSLRMEGFPNT